MTVATAFTFDFHCFWMQSNCDETAATIHDFAEWTRRTYAEALTVIRGAAAKPLSRNDLETAVMCASRTGLVTKFIEAYGPDARVLGTLS